MITWNIDPEIFSLGGIAPRYYGLCFVAAFLIGEKYCTYYLEKKGFTPKEISKLLTLSILGTILGARLGHCLFYEPAYYLSNPLEILYVWQGGLASHGGFLGVILAVLYFTKKVKPISLIWLLDLVAAPALLGGGFIRLGNLMNSEIIGKMTDVPWAFVFKRVDPYPRHPTQLYESLGFFIISLGIMFLYKKYRDSFKPGRFIGLTLILGMSHRIFVEFFKENQVAFENGMMFNMGQLLSFPMIAVGIYLLLRGRNEKN